MGRTKRKVGRPAKNPQRVKPVAYRYIKVREETWAKVERLTRRMQEDPTAYPFKPTVNRVAAMEFEKAIAAIQE